MINILAEGLKIPTTQDLNDENMPKFHALLEKSFPLVHKHMKKRLIGNSLLFTLEGKGNPIMFCGHQDVVPALDADWVNPPFSGIIDDKYVWGRGAIDCKNVVIGLLCAMESLLSEGFSPTRTIYFAFGHDEEIGGVEGASNIVKTLASEGVRLELVLDEGGHVDTDFLPDRNYATIALSEKNIVRLKITAHDKGGHAAYIKDKTALYRIAKAIIAIEENPMDKKIIPLIEKYIEVLGASYPKLVENFVDKKENNPYVRTTIAPTMTEASKSANILPNEPYFICDCRLLPCDKPEDVINHIKNLTKDLDVTIEIIAAPKGEGVATDFNAEFYKHVESMIKEKFDDAIVVPQLMAGGTDARYYEQICDVVLRFAPFLMDSEVYSGLHAANEKILISSFEKGVDFYKSFIKKHG